MHNLLKASIFLIGCDSNRITVTFAHLLSSLKWNQWFKIGRTNYLYRLIQVFFGFHKKLLHKKISSLKLYKAMNTHLLDKITTRLERNRAFNPRYLNHSSLKISISVLKSKRLLLQLILKINVEA